MVNGTPYIRYKRNRKEFIMPEDFMAMYKQALERLSTGGMSLEASLQEIEEGKKQAIAGGQQALVSGGLGGTTVMGGVPLQAEKIAGRQRLGARGRAEETYLTTLASFAAFAQRGIEAQKQREFEAEQAGLGRRFTGRQAELGRIAATGTTQYGRAPRKSLSQFMSEFDVGATGGGYAQQFPSIYGQEGAAAPSLMGDVGGGGYTPKLEEQGWRGAQVIAEKGDGYTPQTGEYMSVAGGPGGPILGGGATTSYGGGIPPSAQPSGKSSTQYSQYQGRGGKLSFNEWLSSGKPTGAPGKYYVGAGYATSPQEYN